jgi:hypothetical protein
MKYFFIALTTITICITAIFFSLRYDNRFIDDQLKGRLSLPIKKKIKLEINWDKVDKKIATSINLAHENAIAHASNILETWHQDKMYKIDNSFLEWYFGYFTQLEIGFKSLGYIASNWWFNTNKSADDQVAIEILKELDQRVFPKLLMQKELENIAQETVSIFINSLVLELQQIPQTFEIPTVDWDQHLEEIAIMLSGVEGLRNQPLSLKAITAGAIIGTKTLTFPLTKILIPSIKATVGNGIKFLSTKAAVKATSKATARRVAIASTSKGCATIASGPFALFVFSGMLAWEAWDHANTVKENRPIMRSQLEQALLQMEKDFLDNNGPIGAPLYQIQQKLNEELKK